MKTRRFIITTFNLLLLQHLFFLNCLTSFFWIRLLLSFLNRCETLGFGSTVILIYYYYVFGEENTKLRKKHPNPQFLPCIGRHSYFSSTLDTGIFCKAIPGPAAFLLKPSMDPGLFKKLLSRVLPGR